MSSFLTGFAAFTAGQAVMLAIGCGLLYLAVAREYEPMLLLPIGFGCILSNIPFSAAVGDHGPLTLLYNLGIVTELFPLLIFIAIGAMMDFGILLRNPRMFLFGGAAQFGIFFTVSVATLLGYDLKEAAAIGIIGAADGPTSIYVATRFARHLLAPISVAAYTYMALVPIIQPAVIRVLTTTAERRIRMPYREANLSRTVRIVFPVAVTVIAGLVAPISVAMVGFLMFGNLLRECGVTDRLAKASQNELANLVTILLGITIGSTMQAGAFLTRSTLTIILLGLVAFSFDTAGGVLFAKLMNLFLKEKINPMVGASGISAFPMSARVIHQLAQKEDPANFLLNHSISANVAGQIGSIIAGGLILALVK